MSAAFVRQPKATTSGQHVQAGRSRGTVAAVARHHAGHHGQAVRRQLCDMLESRQQNAHAVRCDVVTLVGSEPSNSVSGQSDCTKSDTSSPYVHQLVEQVLRAHLVDGGEREMVGEGGGGEGGVEFSLMT